MSYARTQGDWGDIWSGIKAVAGPIIGGAIGGWIGGGGEPVSTMPVFQPPRGGSGAVQIPGTVGGQISFPGGTTVGGQFLLPGQGRLPPFTATGPGVLPGGGRGGGLVPSGYHYTKDGSMRLVRNRRMNVANPRALRRALRRTAGFVKLAKRALKGTGYAVRRA